MSVNWHVVNVFISVEDRFTAYYWESYHSKNYNQDTTLSYDISIWIVFTLRLPVKNWNMKKPIIDILDFLKYVLTAWTVLPVSKQI